MNTLTPEFLKRALGNLDERTLARILALEASETDVLEASAWVAGVRGIGRIIGEPTPRIVVQIAAIACASTTL